MKGQYEQFLLIDCARKIATSFPKHSLAARELSDWLDKTDMGFEWPFGEESFHHRKISQKTWKAILGTLKEAAENIGAPPLDRIQKNAAMLADYLTLDSDSAKIFMIVARTKMRGPLDELINTLLQISDLPLVTLYSCLTGLPLRKVSLALRNNNILIKSGLVTLGSRWHSWNDEIAISDRLLEALEQAHDGVEDILKHLFNEPGSPKVNWEDFTHLGAEANFVARILKGAILKKARGVNVLFYGPPGTGKTEFCKVLAAYIGATLHSVGESDDGGEEPSRYERIQQLRLGQKLLASRGNTLILFDEMEDLLSGTASMSHFNLRKMTSSASKVHMNRLLETNLVPTLWTCNDIRMFDPALLRRLTFTIEMKNPSEKVRARIWGRLAKKEGVSIDKQTCAQLAYELKEPPALVANALRAVVLSDDANTILAEDLRLAVSAIGKVTRGGCEHPPVARDNSVSFLHDLCNADTDLARLTDRLSSKDTSRAISLCLSGSPGTGKSAYARHLAQKMDLPIIQKRASDILSKWVGGSEENIASAFAEARNAGAFLIFDEADSLLSSREMAERSWEVSQVNEMLTWMENHPLPFACTTNLVTRLDIASLRRFTFKVNFLALEPKQLEAAFEQFFNMSAPIGLALLDNLTPGDFANVLRRAKALKINDSTILLAELEKESAAKPGRHRAIGFRPLLN